MVRTIKDVEEEKEELEEITEEKSIYDKEGIQERREEDQLSDWEAGFMEGASEGGEGSKCRRCGKIFSDDDTVLEREIKGKRCLFCSDKCVEEYLDKKKEEGKEVSKDYEH